MATFGIIYASESKMIRRIVANIPDQAARSTRAAYAPHISSSEEVLIVEQDAVPTVFEAEDLVEAATGQRPANPTCCVLENNIVVQIILADAAIDTMPGKTLVQAYAPIPIGSTYDPATGLFTAPGYTIPASPGVPGNPDRPPTEEVIVPPTVIPKP
jgi:hypothetical protein